MPTPKIKKSDGSFVSLIGPQGPTGAAGAPGADGADGADAVYGTWEVDNTNAWVKQKNGTWSPATVTSNFTVRFFRGAGQISTRTFTALLGTVTGTIDVEDGVPTGEATTLTVLRDNTAQPVVLVQHTGSGVRCYVPLLVAESGQDGVDGADGTDGTPGAPGSDGADGEIYYIQALNGLAIKNGTGSLSFQLRKVVGTSDTAVTTGNVKLYRKDNGTLLGDGYSVTLTAANISGSLIIEAKEGATIYATAQAIDVLDGVDAVLPAVTASNGVGWTRAPNAGAWTPTQTFTDLTCVFYRKGVSVATRVVRVTLNTSTGALTVTAQSNSGEGTSYTVDGGGTARATVTFTHTTSGAKLAQSVFAVQGGLNGAPGSDGTDGTNGDPAISVGIEATNGLSWYKTRTGLWVPAENTTDVTATFYRQGVAIATRKVRGTLDTNTGAITVTAVSNTGEATTWTVAAGHQGTARVPITFKHTASGASFVQEVTSVTAGQGGLNPGIGVIRNSQSSLTEGSSQGECFIHGFNDDNQPDAAKDGYVWWQGNKVNVPRGEFIDPNAVVDGYILLDASLTGRFDGQNVVAGVKANGQWVWYKNSGVGTAFAFQPGANVVVIGQLFMDSSEAVKTAEVFGTAQAPDLVPDSAATTLTTRDEISRHVIGYAREKPAGGYWQITTTGGAWNDAIGLELVNPIPSREMVAFFTGLVWVSTGNFRTRCKVEYTDTGGTPRTYYLGDELTLTINVNNPQFVAQAFAFGLSDPVSGETYQPWGSNPVKFTFQVLTTTNATLYLQHLFGEIRQAISDNARTNALILPEAAAPSNPPGGGSQAVTVNPNNISDHVQGSSYLTQPIKASISGFGPGVTYNWSFTSGGAGMTIQGSGSEVRVNVTGTNIERLGTLRCLVTDGAANQGSATCQISIGFGVIP